MKFRGRSHDSRSPKRLCNRLFAVVVAEDFEKLKAEFEQSGCASGGIEAEGDRNDGGFGDRHPSVFSIEISSYEMISY